MKIKIEDGSIIERKVTSTPCGNFQVLTINYKNAKYFVGDGDEYLRGFGEYLNLGSKVKG